MRVVALTVLAVAGVAGSGLTVAGAQAGAATGGPTVLEQSFTSRAVGGALKFRVYLPAGYGANSQRYPVVYLLGGLPDAGTTFRQTPLQAIGAAASRAGRPVIVVAPQAARPGDTDPEYHDWGPGRNWETALSSELVHTVDARLRTIRDRGARALIGISAGGYGATIIAVHHPRTFSLAQSWSGYFAPTSPSGSEPLSVGDAEANGRASVHSYVSSLGGRPKVRLDFYVGDRDAHFVPDNKRLDRELTEARVNHRFRVYTGGHDPTLWSAHEEAWTADAVGRLVTTS